MKKIKTLLCALLVVLTASAAGWKSLPATNVSFDFNQSQQRRSPAAAQASPVNASIIEQTYNSATFKWFYYLQSGSGFACALYDADKQFVAAVTWTYEAFQYAAYLDGITFEDDEIEYYCSTYWILNAPDGFHKGSAWDKNVISVNNEEAVISALKPGTYYIQINELDDYGMTDSAPASLSFTLTDTKISNLQAAVASDNKTATLTWEAPEMPANSYVYLTVSSGETVVFDNYDDNNVTSPLTVDVQEGRSYKATAQIIQRDGGKKLGSEVVCNFTVGTNVYTPLNPTATVSDGDEVHFAWGAQTAAAYYRIMLYKDGEFYGSTSSKTTSADRTLETGNYTWEVAAFEIGSDELYYPLSEYVAGNAFSTQSAELPAETEVLDIAYLEAAYITLPSDDSDYREGYHPWLIQFGSNTTSTLPSPWIVIYSTRESAISGRYSFSRDNVSKANCFIYLDQLGGDPANYGSMATDAELILNFDGFAQDYVSQGYHYGTYSGSVRMTCENGKTYYGTFSNLFCLSYHYEYLQNPSSDYIGMYDEDTGDALDIIEAGAELDLNRPMYNVTGQQVNAEYKGIVIQNGRKYLLK